MNHNPNQEPNSILSRLTDGFNDEFISQMKAAREAQKTSEEKEAAYRQIEKEAAKTSAEAEKAYSIYKMAEEITQALLVKEAEAQLAAEESLNKANTEIAGSISRDDGQQVLDKTKQALDDLAAAAKDQLAYRKEARVNAEKEEARLNLAAAIAAVKNSQLLINKARAYEEYVHCENLSQICDAQNRIYFSQLAMMHEFEYAKDIQKQLTELIRQQQELTAQAGQMSDSQHFVDNIRSQLAEKLQNVNSELIPYEKELLTAADREQIAKNDYELALAEANQAQERFIQKERESHILEEAAKSTHDAAQKEYNIIIEQNNAKREKSKTAINQLTEAAGKLWEQERSLESQIYLQTQKRIAINTEKTALETTLQKTLGTKKELERLLSNANTINITDDTAGAADKPEMLIKNALDEANNQFSRENGQVEQLNHLLNALNQQISHDEIRRDQAKASADELDKQLAEAQQNYRLLDLELNQTEQLGQNTMSELCAVVDSKSRLARQSAVSSKLKADQLAASLQKAADKLEAAKQDLLNAENQRETAKRRLSNAIEHAQQDTAAAVSKHELLMLSAWEKSEKLRLAAESKYQELELLLNNARTAAGKEDIFISNAEKTAAEAQEKLDKARQITAALLKEKANDFAIIDAAIDRIRSLDNTEGMDAETMISQAEELSGSLKEEINDMLQADTDIKYAPHIPSLQIPLISELGLNEPAHMAKPVFDGEHIGAVLTSMIRDLTKEYADCAAQKIAAWQQSSDAVQPVKAAAITDEIELDDESAAIPFVPEALEQMSGAQFDETIANATKDAFKQQLAKTEKTKDSGAAPSIAAEEYPQPDAEAETICTQDEDAEQETTAASEINREDTDTVSPAEQTNIAGGEIEKTAEQKPRRGFLFFGKRKKKGQEEQPAVLPATAAKPAEPISQPQPITAAAKPQTVTITATEDKDLTNDLDASRLSVEVEEHRLQLAAETYDQRQQDDADSITEDNAEERIKEEKRRLAEAESARIREEEEAAQLAEELAAARAAQQKAEDLAAAERLAQSAAEDAMQAAKEIGLSQENLPGNIQEAAVLANDSPEKAELAAYGESMTDDDSLPPAANDVEEEMRKLILSDLQKEK